MNCIVVGNFFVIYIIDLYEVNQKNYNCIHIIAIKWMKIFGSGNKFLPGV